MNKTIYIESKDNKWVVEVKDGDPETLMNYLGRIVNDGDEDWDSFDTDYTVYSE